MTLNRDFVFQLTHSTYIFMIYSNIRWAKGGGDDMFPEKFKEQGVTYEKIDECRMMGQSYGIYVREGTDPRMYFNRVFRTHKQLAA